MPLIAPSTDYTDKDFDALRSRVRNLVSAAFPQWTDDNIANFGNMLLDLVCFVGDVESKYQDSQARETRWGTATGLKNILNLCKMIGYTPPGATAALVTERFTLATPAAAAIILPKGQKVFTLDAANPIGYQLLEALTIPAGTTVAEATLENSEFEQDVVDSTGSGNQRIALARTPYLDTSAIVVAANGAYTQAKNFLSSSSSDRHYTAFVDATGRARITFGNGVNGAIPSGTITIDYKTGGGLAGRVDAEQLKSMPGSFADNFGFPVTITVTNPTASSTPADRQSVAQTRLLAPLDVRVSDRCIAREDFEIVARTTTGVSRALFVGSNEDASVPENEGFLYLVPPGSGTASDQLITAVRQSLTVRPYGNTFRLHIRTAAYLPVNVQVVAYKRANTTPAQLKANVLKVLGDMFADTVPAFDVLGNRYRNAGAANPLVDFGFYRKNVDGLPSPVFAYSDVFDACRNAPGVLRLDPGATGFLLNGARADAPIEVRQFPKLGTVTVIDADTGTSL